MAETLIPGLNKLGLKPIGAFTLTLGPETPALYLLIPSSSLDLLTNVGVPACARRRLYAGRCGVPGRSGERARLRTPGEFVDGCFRRLA